MAVIIKTYKIIQTKLDEKYKKGEVIPKKCAAGTKENFSGESDRFRGENSRKSVENWEETLDVRKKFL